VAIGLRRDGAIDRRLTIIDCPPAAWRAFLFQANLP
jgi:hypothetical protein